MNVVEAMNKRHSVRAFTSQPVSKEILVSIMDAALRTPSAANSQPWEVFIATGEPLNSLRQAFVARHRESSSEMHPDPPTFDNWPKHIQQRMAENIAAIRSTLPLDEEYFVQRNRELFGAPAVVYLCMDSRLGQISVFDTGMLAQSIMLAAQQYGVDSIPALSLIAFQDILRAKLLIPDDLTILMAVALGYAYQSNPINQYKSTRRPVREAVRFVGC